MLAAVTRSPGEIVIDALFSHHFPLTRAGEAFEFAMKRPPDAIKIVVTVN